MYLYAIQNPLILFVSLLECRSILGNIMKIILDIKEKTRIPFFMELLKSLDYINVVKKVENKRKSQFIDDLAEAFEDVKAHEQGKKKLKSAKELLNEL